MKVNVVTVIKEAQLIQVTGAEVNQSTVILNPGASVPTEYVEYLDGGLVNVHLSSGDTIVAIPLNAISFDREANDEYLSKRNSPPLSPTHGLDVDDIKTTKVPCGGCGKRRRQ